MNKWLFLILSISSGVHAQNFSGDKDRLMQTLLEQDQLIKDLQREIRQLRGDNEQIHHQLQLLQQNQRDIEQRLGKTNAPNLSSPVAANSMNSITTMNSMGSMNVTPPVQTPPPAQPPVLPALSLADPKTTTAPQEYQQAFDLLQRGQYEKATQVFESFIKQSPTGDYADNAQYWLGEAYYSKRDFVGALAAFKKLVDNYPDSPKKSHALLKIGFSYDELGDKVNARQTLEQVRNEFPATMPARLADERLKKLR
ncbi:MAG: tol-pal system protein YbgF [Pseudomonadota bacterium]|jgi:tol-pal system protein YbgF